MIVSTISCEYMSDLIIVIEVSLFSIAVFMKQGVRLLLGVVLWLRIILILFSLAHSSEKEAIGNAFIHPL